RRPDPAAVEVGGARQQEGEEEDGCNYRGPSSAALIRKHARPRPRPRPRPRKPFDDEDEDEDEDDCYSTRYSTNDNRPLSAARPTAAPRGSGVSVRSAGMP